MLCFLMSSRACYAARAQGVDSLMKPWLPPTTDATPMRTIAQAIRAYEPGQGFIDGGGFKIVKESDTYLYVQFESLKKGKYE